MATRKPRSKPDEPERPLALAVPREEAKARLVARIETGQKLSDAQVSSAESLQEAKHAFDKWSSFNTELLKQLFTTDALSQKYSYWDAIVLSMGHRSLGQEIAEYHKELVEKLRRLDSILERLELYPISSTVQATEAAELQRREASPRSRKVFVVHGRDELSKTTLEVILHEIGLEPIVLHRQADEGLTVIEKFEKHSDVAYAFILLTPDEIAYLASQEPLAEDQRTKEKRARPNVIFEFGYFVGKLGRARVCCLYTGDVTLPSDVNGLVYKKFTESVEEVAYAISKDLRAAGFNVA